MDDRRSTLPLGRGYTLLSSGYLLGDGVHVAVGFYWRDESGVPIGPYQVEEEARWGGNSYCSWLIGD